MAWTAPRTWSDGELVTAAIMNPHVRDNLLAAGPHLIVRKASDESVASSTVFQDDNDLILPVTGSDVWLVQYFLRVLDSSGDIKVGFSFPASGTITFHTIWPDAGGTISNFAWTGTASPNQLGGMAVSASPGNTMQIWGTYLNGGTGGNVTLQWAQNTASGTTTIKANSTLWAVKLA